MPKVRYIGDYPQTFPTLRGPDGGALTAEPGEVYDIGDVDVNGDPVNTPLLVPETEAKPVKAPKGDVAPS